MNELVTGLKDIDLRPQFVVASTSSVSTVPNATTTDDQGLYTSVTFSTSSSSTSMQNLDLNNRFIAPTATKSNFFINLDEDNNFKVTSSTTTSAKNVATTSSPKVSFKIQKIFNKLEKSTENLLSSTSSTSSSSSSSVATTTVASAPATVTTSGDTSTADTSMDLEALKKKEDSSGQVSKDQEEDGKKRPLAPVKDEEPLAKKSKSTKIDA